MKFISIAILFLVAVLSCCDGVGQTLRIDYANDFFAGTDRFFTQGIRIEFIHPIAKKTPVRFLSLLNANHKKSVYSLAVQQDGFTPSSISRDTIMQGDRPFCGSLFLTNSQYIINEQKKVIYQTHIALGVIGPMALGYEEQTAIHKSIKNILPKGWRHQIQNDLIVNYTFAMQQNLLQNELFDANALTQIRVGTMFTDLSGGAMLRIGFKNNWNPVTVFAKKGKPQLFMHTSVQLKAVGYNATLQGGLLNRNSAYTISSKNIQRITSLSEIGVTASFHNILATYTQCYLSKEFNTGLRHRWGKIGLQIVF